MKVFEESMNTYPTKVNFVDKNNVFVGYDLDQQCCEDAGWYLSYEIGGPHIKDWNNLRGVNISRYVFDIEFFEDISSESEYTEEENTVVFKLIKDGSPDIFLHLYNTHNGYYGHGFVVKHGGEKVQTGIL